MQILDCPEQLDKQKRSSLFCRSTSDKEEKRVLE
jgi:hypothetical protein